MRIKLFISISLILQSFCFAQVTLNEMISQMIMVGFTGKNPEDKWAKQIKLDISQNRIGGILLLQRNVESKEQLRSLLKSFNQTKSKLPNLIAIDQEGGKITRLSSDMGFTSFPTARKVANDMTLIKAKETYKKMAQNLKNLGINYNLAPVVDILINPTEFERQRCFSKYPSIVTAYASSFIEGFDEVNILTSLKHFPGYASANTDAHEGIVDITSSWQFDELRPYFDLIKSNNARSIMVSHVYLKQFDSNYPASLSKKIINGILRDELKYNGVVISDDLMMKSLREFSIEERIIKSINAGVDILLLSEYFLNRTNTPKAVKAIITNAINNGQITEERIAKSYERIAKMKERLD